MTKVLLIVKENIPSVILCGRAQLEYLAARGELEFRCVLTGDVTSADLNWADGVMFIRAADEPECALALLCKAHGKDLAYVLDDDLLNLPDTSSSAPYYRSAQIQQNIRDIMGACGTFLTPSTGLLEKYGTRFARTVLMDEPSFPTECCGREEGGPVRIGFAGSFDRTADVENLLRGAVEQVIAACPGQVCFEFFGIAPAFAAELGLRTIAFCDYAQYSEIMKNLGWDVALAPMPRSEFHRCKYFNKYTEYASFGIAGIYSAEEPYTRVIRDGENGLLCENTPESWAAAILRLVKDAGLRRKISAAAYGEAETRFSLPQVSEPFLAAVREFATGAGTRVSEGELRQIRLRFFGKKLRRKREEYGWRLPLVAAKKLLAGNSGGETR